MPAARLDALRDVLRPVPLTPFLPTLTAGRPVIAPGLLARVSSDEGEAVVTFGALRRGSLTPLREHVFRWRRFDA
ncbi:hypothetical protein [Streptomyces sp. NBC_01477]|uniref:hypothetical protein n=1 Tax=Streptomyces sp. NBC_01477 TaxID=2976015 RepID=UPI002E372A16|nr:hypothetical protein [Streptomyces sp. NBC_01477]